MTPNKKVASSGADQTSEEVMENTASTPRPPRLGEVISVMAGSARLVVNLEYGGVYSETEAVPAAVTLRVLRLLKDGDLVRQ